MKSCLQGKYLDFRKMSNTGENNWLRHKTIFFEKVKIVPWFVKFLMVYDFKKTENSPVLLMHIKIF